MPLAFVFVLLHLAGCVPARGALPAQTWRADDNERVCAPEALLDPHSARWSSAAKEALAAKVARGEPVVVSALGCRVEVLEQCTAPSAYVREGDRWSLPPATVTSAKSLAGECTDATHVVVSASASPGAKVPSRVTLGALTLDDFRVAGVWRGVMRQPGGPYESYEVVMDLAQEGDRVSGITHLFTVDNKYWGQLRVEGRVEGNTVYFADAEIIDDNLGIFLGWCLKTGYSVVDPRRETMRGPWKAGGCEPGTLVMRRLGESSGGRVLRVAMR